MRWTFRLRTLLLVVLVLGAVGGLLINTAAERRRAYYRTRVETYAYGEADVLDQIVAKLEAARRVETLGPDGQAQAAALRAEAEHLARIAAWHVKMERRYARAVDYPWEPLPPDPPPPPSATP
jgi:hypothetical protein